MNKSFKSLILIIIAVLLSFSSLFGQDRMIRGVVTTLDSIPEKVLRRCRLGKSVGFLVSDIEEMLLKIASGEVRIGRVNK